MGKQKSKAVNTNSLFGGLDTTNTTTPDDTGGLLAGMSAFKRGTFSTLENTDKGVDLDNYKHLGEGLINFGSVEQANTTRARNQSNWEQVYHAGAKFLPNVALEILNQAGSILDVEDYFNSDDELGNWLSTWATEQKAASNARSPIYRENEGEALDFGDFAWWMENGSSLVESVTAFAAVGFATGGANLAALNRGAKALEFFKVLGKGKAAASGTKAAIQGAATVNNAFLLNHAEGMGIATSVYATVYKRELEKLQAAGNKDADALAKKKAAKQGESALSANRINMVLNLSSASLFMKTPALTRQVRKAVSSKKNISRAVGEGFQESGEETINMLAEKQALDDDYGFTKGLEDVLSKEGFEAQLLGFVGGAGQTGLTNAGRRLKLRKDEKGSRISDNTLQNRAYAKQKESLDKIAEMSKGEKLSTSSDAIMRSKEVFQLHREIDQAFEDGDTPKFEQLKGQLLSNQAYDAFSNGTTEQLINVFKGIKDMDVEAAGDKGMDVKTYKDQATEAIDFIEGLEVEFNKSQAFVNAADVYSNRARNTQLRTRKAKLEANLPKIVEEVKQDLADLGVKEEEIEIDGQLAFKIKTKKNIEGLASLADYKASLGEIREIRRTQTRLGQRHLKLTSAEEQTKIKEKIRKGQEELAEEALEDELAPVKKKATEQKAAVVQTAEDNKVVKAQEDAAAAIAKANPTAPAAPTTDQSYTFKSDNPGLVTVVDGANKVMASKVPTKSKIESLKRGIAHLTKNAHLEGMSGIIAQHTEAIRVLEAEEEAQQAQQAQSSMDNSDIDSALDGLANDMSPDEFDGDVALEQDSYDGDQDPISQDKEEQIVGQVRKLIHALNVMEDAGLDTSNFKVVSDRLQKTVGEEKHHKIFEKFKSLYNLTGQSPVPVVDTYESLYFTDAENEAIASNDQIVRADSILNDFYSHTAFGFKLEEKRALKEYIESQGYKVNAKENVTEADSFKIVEAYNKVAHLDKKFKNHVEVTSVKFNVLDFVTSKQDIDRELNDAVDEVLLDPSILKKGEAITFKVLDEVIYEDGTIVTKEGTVTKDGETVNRKPSEIAPIAIFYKGEQIKGAYLHTMDWVNDANIAESGDVARQRRYLSSIRQAVLDAGLDGITSKVSERSDGWLLADPKGAKNLVSINLPKVQIGIGKDGFVETGELTIANVDGKDIQNGMPYAVITTGSNEQRALPIQPIQIKEHPEYIESMVNAVKMYFANDPNDTRVNKLAEETGINIRSIKGLEQYLNKFIHLYPYKDSKTGKSYYKFNDFKKLLNSKDDNLSMVRIVGDNLEFGRGFDVGGAVGFLNRQILNQLPADKRKATIEKGIEKFTNVISNNSYMNVNKDAMLKDFQLPLITDTDVNVTTSSYDDFIKQHLRSSFYSHTLPNGKEIYTIQSNIEFDTSFAVNEKPVRTDTAVETPMIEVAAPKVVTSGDTTYTFSTEEFNEEDLDPVIDDTGSISDIFNNTPDLAKAGTVQEYLDYLGTVFPNSEVSYPLYHGTKNKFKTFDVNTWNNETDKIFHSKGFWFTHFEEEAENYGGIIKTVLVDIKKPHRKPVGFNAKNERVFADQVDDVTIALEQGNDSAILDINEGGLDGESPVTEYVVFDPKQIHTLGSKEDIEGFKKYTTVDLDPTIISDERLAELKGTTPKSLLIQGVHINIQNTVVDHLTANFLKSTLKDGDSSAAFNSFVAFKDTLKSAREHYNDARKSDDANQARVGERYHGIVSALYNNYDSLIDLAVNKLSKVNGLNVKLEGKTMDLLAERLDFDSADSNAISEDGELKEYNNWANDDVFRENIKEKMSTSVKNFFSAIDDAQVKDGVIVPVKGFLGITKTVSFDAVINDLNAILSYHNDISEGSVITPTFDNMVEVIENWVDKKPYLQNVLEALDDADEKIKNEFVSVMSKHYTHHIYVLKNKDGKFFVNNSDANNIVETIQTKWMNNLYDNDLIQENDGTFVVDGEKVAELEIEVEGLIQDLKSNSPDKYKTGSSVLKKLGFGFEDALVKHLIDNGVKYSKNHHVLLHMLTSSDGAIKLYLNNLKAISGKDVQANHPFADNTALKGFAREIGKSFPTYFASSFKDVRGRTYFGYSSNKFLTDRVRELKSNEYLLRRLQKQPFTANSLWGNALLNDSKFKKYFGYFTYDGTTTVGKEVGKKLEQSSPAEVEQAKVALFFSMRKGRDFIIRLFYPTTSNKTVQPGLQVLGKDWADGTNNGQLRKNQQHELFEILVQPEINRILSIQDDADKHNIKGYEEGGRMFNMLPALNNVKELWEKDGKLKTNINSDAKLKAVVLSEIRQYINSAVSDKLSKWDSYGLIETKEEVQMVEGDRVWMETPRALIVTGKDPKAEAFNFVVNYLVANVNIYQTFITDPAFYFKSKQWKTVVAREGVQETVNTRQGALKHYNKEDWLQEHEDIFNNIGKRLAADAAPGTDLPNSVNDSFVLGYLRDSEREVYLMEYYTALLGAEGATDYLAANSTDAQEFTTLSEHLHVLVLQGKLSTEDKVRLEGLEISGSTLLTKDIAQIFQPVKPVYVANHWKNDIEHRIYVKSSSFPLIKQLTRNLEIDKLRVAMVEQKVDRIAFESAVKVGGTNTGTQIYTDNEGTVSKSIKIDTIGRLSREGFKIQQEIPYDENKQSINDGTQQIKLLTANLRDIKGFKVRGDDSSHTGQSIQDLLDKSYKAIYDEHYTNLVADIEYDEINNTLNTDKLAELLRKEAVTRGYPLYDIAALDTYVDQHGETKFIVPLWLTGVSGKLEAMLNSIVDSRVRKLKPKGKSYTLGASEGFKPVKQGKDAQDTINNTTGIVWDAEWFGRTDGQLQPMRIEDANGNVMGSEGFDKATGFVKYAEILVPFKFKDDKGKLVKVEDYTNEDGTMDMTKLSPELLNMFGFRIPTQYLNSMSAIKVVGFLPKSSGDLLLAPADWAVQMGSDFDADKLYSNSYNTSFDSETGALSIYEGDSVIKTMENHILDLHFSIMGNKDAEVQRRILKPLDFGMLKDLADEIYGFSTGRSKGYGMTEEYQSFKYLNARAGKAGIGVFSTDNTFIAAVQNKGIFLQKREGTSIQAYSIRLGGQDSNMISDTEVNVKGANRDKTDVISAFQSLAVDDENEQGLFKLNINTSTFDAIRTLVMSGFEEDIISYFINQPIIKKYTELKVQADDSLSPLKEIEIPAKIAELFPITDTTLDVNGTDFKLKYGNTSKAELLRVISGGEADVNRQRALFNLFTEVTEFGKNIQFVQSTINTHSAGLGKDLFYSTIKAQQVNSLQNYSVVANADKLIGEYMQLDGSGASGWGKANDTEKLKMITDLRAEGYMPTTEVKVKGDFKAAVTLIKPTTLAGFTTTNALNLNNKMWSRFFPYGNRGIDTVIDALKVHIGKGTSLGSQSDNSRQAFSVIKSYLAVTGMGTYTDGDVLSERNRLMIDTKDNKSLASIIHLLRNTNKISNDFINRLELDLKKEVLPSNIVYKASVAENVDERMINASFAAMLLNNTTVLGEFNGITYTPQKLAQDLITQQLLMGGVQKSNQFIKYIPINYLVNAGYYAKLDNTNFEDAHLFNGNAITSQYLQHNPDKVQVKGLDVGFEFFEKKTIVRKTSEGDAFMDGVFSIKNPKAVSGYDIYFFNEVSDQWEQKDTLGLKDLLEYNNEGSYGESIIKSNQVPKVKTVDLPTDPTKVNKILEVAKVNEKGPDVISEPNNESLNDFYNLKSNEDIVTKLSYIFNKIQTTNKDPYHQLMATEIGKNLDKISDYKFIINRNLKAKGSHSLKDKTIQINPTKFRGREQFESTIIEEVIHALTKKAINDNKTGEVLRLKGLLNVAQEAVKEHLASLNLDPEMEFAKVIYAMKRGEALTPFQGNVIYPVINEAEFIGRLFKSKKLQELLNNKEGNLDDKSLLAKVWDYVIEILNSVGLDIKKGSALEYAVKDILSLINLETPPSSVTGEIARTQQKERTPDFIVNKFNLLNEDGSQREVDNAQEVADWVNLHTSNLEAKVVKGYVVIENKPRYNDQFTLDLDPDTIEEKQKGKASPLLRAYNNRMKNLEKLINKAEVQGDYQRSERLKDQLEIVTEKRNETVTISSLRNIENTDLYYKGQQDMEEVKEMLKSTLTLEDTLYIRKIIHFWKKATTVLFDEQDRNSSKLMEDFKSIEKDAEVLEDLLVKEETKFMNSFIRKHGKDISVADIFAHFKDINGLSSRTLDISRSGNELLNSVFKAVKEANIDALDETNEVLKDLQDMEDSIRPILKEMGHTELYDVFRQRTADGNLTGHLVKRINRDFSRGFNSQLNSLRDLNNVDGFKAMLNWGRENLKAVKLEYLIKPNQLSKEDQALAKTYREELKAELGAVHYAEYVGQQAEMVNLYQKKLDSKLRNIAEDANVKPSEIYTDVKLKKELDTWVAKNSPYMANQYLEGSFPKVAGDAKGFNNFDFVIPLPKDANGYDANYKKIESNPKLLAFYKYYNKIDAEMQMYLPDDVKRSLAYTGVPHIGKTILELFKDKGMKVGLAPIWDEIRKSIRIVEEDVISTGTIDPVTNKVESGVAIKLTKENGAEINKHTALKALEYRTKTSQEATVEMMQKWRAEKIHELATLKSFDLGKILKVYTMTTLAYKHKSKIEDSVQLAQNILESQEEYQRTEIGKIKTDTEGNLIKNTSDNSFKNLKFQFEYFVDKFKGKSNPVEGVTTKVVLTSEEKKEKKEMEALKGALDKSLDAGTISKIDHGNSITTLDGYIDELGGVAVQSKRVDNALKWVQLTKMGWNVMSSISNVGFGYIANRIEASGGEHYTGKQLTDAYKLTGHSLWKNATFNTQETETAKKIRSIMDGWDILKDASHELFSKPLDVSLGRKTKWLSPYNVTQRTEYINQAPIMIAMMMNTKIKTDKGDVTLWDGFGKDGKWDSSKGNVEASLLAETTKTLRMKIDQVNKMNHGNYDPTSALALKKNVLGRAVSQFRTWMFEGYAIRFEKAKKDAVLGDRKGRYVSTKDFFSQVGLATSTSAILKGLTRSATLGYAFKSHDFKAAMEGTDLTDNDAANLRKTMTEAIMYLTLGGSYLMLKSFKDGLDDDDDRKYVLNLLLNQTGRLKTDILFYLDPRETKNLMKDLIPVTSLITDTFQMVDAIAQFAMGEDDVKGGIYKGDSRLLREVLQSMPLGTQAYKSVNYVSQTFEK